MNVEFLGLSMSKRSRITVIVSLILVVLCLVLYVVSGFFIPKAAPVVVLPSGQLSESIFELQNMEYTAAEGFTRRYLFANLPYSVDVPAGELAKVDGADFLYSEPYYFYYDVMSVEEDIKENILTHITGVVAPFSNSGESQVTILKEESGNINGCSCTYMVGCVSVADKPAQYFCIYKLHLDENIYVSTYDMVVGCISAEYTTENLARLQLLAHATVGTLQYDAERARELAREGL